MSSILQGSALESLQAFFIALLQSRAPAASFESLLNALLAAGRPLQQRLTSTAIDRPTLETLPFSQSRFGVFGVQQHSNACAGNAEQTGKAAQVSIAQCIAALCQSAGGQKIAATVQSLLAVLQSKSGQASATHLALLSVGEIGRSADLSAFSNLQQTLTAALASSSEDLKTAASQALGAVCVGNLSAYLPFVLQQIREQVGCESPPKALSCDVTVSLPSRKADIDGMQRLVRLKRVC